MKKFLLISSLLTITVVSAALAFGGRSGDGDAKGMISELAVSHSMTTVSGRTENGKLWLGYTVYWKDNFEKDYPPMEVKKTFTKTLTYQLRPQGVNKVTVCLWNYKVSKDKCAEERGGTPCIYCRKNGFHMEGRVDCRSGIAR
jgi:hypothetical protein